MKKANYLEEVAVSCNGINLSETDQVDLINRIIEEIEKRDMIEKFCTENGIEV